MDNTPTPSDLIAGRIRDLRTERRMTVKELAARCADAGMPELTAQVLYKLEGQRDSATRTPRPVTVDELPVLARALGIEPYALLAGLDGFPPHGQLRALDIGQLEQAVEGMQAFLSFQKWRAENEG